MATPAMLGVISLAALAASLEARDKDKPGREQKSKDKARNSSAAPAVARKVDETAHGATTGKASNHPLLPVLDAAKSSREAVRKLHGYSCLFSKQEQLKKGPLVTQVMSLKLRHEPFSVYLKFSDPHEGREVIYVEGQNKGKMLVHEPSGLASLVSSISLSPTGNEALKENRHPVTKIGMEKLVDALIVQWEQELAHADIRVQSYPHAKVGEAECRMFEIKYPHHRPHFKAHILRLYIDKQTNLPIRGEQYGFPGKEGDEPPLVEEYTYSDVRTNAALTDADFDVTNASYGFK